MADRAAGSFDVEVEKSHFITMRDGVRLSTDLYFPVNGPHQLPAIVIRTPYGKTRERQAIDADLFASHGYAVAIQDVRGRFESEGTFESAFNEREDGYDTLSWIASQPWSTGKIGTYGCSYLGLVQTLLAATRHPNHRAAIIQAPGGLISEQERCYNSAGYENGVLEFASSLGWVVNNIGTRQRPVLSADLDRDAYLALAERFSVVDLSAQLDLTTVIHDLPIRSLALDLGGPAIQYPIWEFWLTTPFFSDAMRASGRIFDEDRFDVPAIHVNSWFDYGVRDTLGYFKLFREHAVSRQAADHQYLIVSPTTHCGSEAACEHTIVGGRNFGDARLDYWRIYLDWFDYWLKDVTNSITQMPKVQLYQMGTNQWHSHDQWPVPGTSVTTLYLTSQGRANSRFGDGVLTITEPELNAADTFTYDPATPVPTVGGPFHDETTVSAGPRDQSAVEVRHDVLVFTTEPLETALSILGACEAALYVSSSARDTDITIKLVEVLPDGTAWNIVDSIMRVRYREGIDTEVFMEPDHVYEVRVPLQPTSMYVKAGHRIRLEISSSNFPRFERNLNTGGRNWDETEWVVARNTIHHGPAHSSRLVLPVMPGPEGRESWARS
jgi:hypothetical protein